MLRSIKYAVPSKKDFFARRLPWRKLWVDNAGLDWAETTTRVAQFLENSLGIPICQPENTHSCLSNLFCIKRIFLFHLRSLNCKIKRSALVYHTLCPHPSAMPMDNALHGRQADADTGEFLFAVQALESAKQLEGVVHIKPAPSSRTK